MESINPQFISATERRQGDGPVYLLRNEYDRLIRITHQYSNLCQNLISGGVNQNTIQLLSDNVSSSPPAQTPQDLSVRAPSQAQSLNIGNTSGQQLTFAEEDSQPHLASEYGRASSSQFIGQIQDQNNGADYISEDACDDIPGNVYNKANDTNTDQANVNENYRPHYDRVATRSVQLFNLPDETTHADITAVVRGGLLLDVYLRRKDGTASIAFVTHEDAQSFYDHVHKNDLYINNKRIGIVWCERQYLLPGHIARKISAGATRNIVIRRCDPSHTEASIREDLYHIHNLVVVKIRFSGGDCYISTNSVTHALYARTCMTSRLKYKGSRIEWDVDECTGSLDQMPISHRRRSVAAIAPVRPSVNTTANRFELLDLEDD